MANTIVQNVAAVQYNNTTSVGATYGSACTNPSLLVAEMTSDGVDTPTLGVSDPTNGTWTKDVSTSETANHGASAIFSQQNTAASALTVTGTVNANSFGILKIYELTGAPTSAALDTSGTQNDLNAPSIALTLLANDSVFACATGYSSYSLAAADTGFTLAFGPTAINFNYSVGEHRADSSGAGSVTLTWNGVAAPSAGQAFSVAAYKTAAVGGGGGLGVSISPLHPGRSPGLGGISSARFNPSNWWPYTPPPTVIFDPAFMIAMEKHGNDPLVLPPQVVASGMSPPNNVPL